MVGYFVSLLDFTCSQSEEDKMNRLFFASNVEAVAIVNDPRLPISLPGNRSSLSQGVIAFLYAGVLVSQMQSVEICFGTYLQGSVYVQSGTGSHRP